MLWTSLLALCVVSVTVVTPTRGETVTKLCEDEPTPDTIYTTEVIAKLDKEIIDIDVSLHTGNVYIIDSQYTLRVSYKDEHNFKQISKLVDAVAVDKHVPKVYLGVKTGLKMFDEVTGDVTDVTKIKHWIWQLFLPKNSALMYFVDGMYDKIYRYQNLVPEGIKLNVKIAPYYEHRFVVDEQQSVYFTTRENNMNVTKILMKGKTDPITFSGGIFFALGVDNSGRVYGVANQSLYRLKADGSEPQMITRLNFDTFHMSFDEDNNIFFATHSKSILKYKFQYKCVTISDMKGGINAISIEYDRITKEVIKQNEILLENNKKSEATNMKNLTQRDKEINELKDTNKQITNQLNSVLSEIESLKTKLNITSVMYDDLLSKTHAAAEERKKKMTEKKIADIVSEKQSEDDIIVQIDTLIVE